MFKISFLETPMRGGKLIGPHGRLRGPIAAGVPFLLISAMPKHVLSVLITVAVYGSASKRFKCLGELLQLLDQQHNCLGKMLYHNSTERFIRFSNICAIIFMYLFLFTLQNL